MHSNNDAPRDQDSYATTRLNNIVRLRFKASANDNPSSDRLANQRPGMSVVMCGLTGRGRILQTKGSRLNKSNQICINVDFIEDLQ